MKKDLSNKWIIIYSFIIYLLNYLIIKKEKDLSNKWINIYSFSYLICLLWDLIASKWQIN